MIIAAAKSPKNKAHRNGYSLVEIIVTLSVLGILTSIVVAGFAGVDDSARETQHKSNAQEIAALCMEAQIAGLDFVVPNNLHQTIKNVIAGGTPSEGALRGVKFSNENLASADVASVCHFLKLNGKQLCYKGAEN